MMPNPWVVLVIILLWIASIVGVGVWQRHDGANTCNASWQAREAKEQADAVSQIKTLEDAALASEQKHAADVVAISTNYEQELQDAHRQHLADITNLRSGALRLRDPNATSLRACPYPAGQAAAGTSGRDDSAPGGFQNAAAGVLPSATSAWLIDFADQCDRNTQQLTACQQVIMDDRR